MSKEMEHQNYYLLLELRDDPPEHDEAVIKSAIRKKLAYWQKKFSNAKYREQAKEYMSLLATAEKSMSSREFRENEAKAAREIKRVEQQRLEKEKYEKLNKIIYVLSQKGCIFEHEIDLMEKETSLTRAEIRSKITAVPVKNGTAKPSAKKDTKPALGKEKMGQINTLLQTLVTRNPQRGNFPTLYDLLELPERASEEELYSKANSSYTKLITRGAAPGIVAEKDAFSHAMIVFKEKEQRQKYDEAVRIQRFQPIAEVLKIAASTKELDEQVYEALVEQAMNEGLSQKDAEERIAAVCEEERIIIGEQTEKKPPALDLQQCGVCGHVNNGTGSTCTKCGSQLTVICKKCRSHSPASAEHCSNCGIGFAEFYLQGQFIRRAEWALLGKDLQAAADYIEKAKFYCAVNDEVKIAERKVRNAMDQVRNSLQLIDELTSEQRFYAAERELLRVKQLNPNDNELLVYERTIKNRINMAEAFLNKAAAYSRTEDMIQCYVRALEECADCQQAIEKLNQFPPAAPNHLQLKTGHDFIRLEWTSAYKGNNVTFMVERQEGRGARQKIAETSDCFFVDRKAEPGKNYSYTVYTSRGDKVSNEGVTNGPIMRIAEVENLRAFSMEGGISLEWKAPANTRVEIWKKEGAIPVKQGDGQKLAFTNSHEFNDRSASKGKVYGYLLIAVYEDEEGRRFYTKGVGILAASIVHPASSIVVDEQSDAVYFKWDTPASGTLQLFYSEFPYDDLELNECFEYSKLVRELDMDQVDQPAPGFGKKPRDFSGILYILPVAKYGGCAVVGQPFVIKAIHPVSQVRGRLDDNGTLTVQWSWPDHAEKVMVRYSEKSFSDPSAQNREISKTYYNNFNGFKIDHVGKEKDLFLTIFVTEELEGEKYFSKAVNYRFPDRGPVEIRYSVLVRKKGILKKEKFASLAVKAQETGLPTILVVRQDGRIPNRKTDGQVIKRIDAEAGEGELTIDLTEFIKEGSYIKLFFEENEDAQNYTLVNEKGRLNLF